MVDYNEDLVVAKIKQCFPSFPNKEQEKIMAILVLYGKESYECETERVQIAVLKLSDGDLEKLRENVDAAKNDYRDILAFAEYPEQMSRDTWKMSDKEEVKRIQERDRLQYLNWLNKNLNKVK
ncbi:MAG: hypothetical protein M3R14_14090 [Acidobacteriota bacterium]|nr:hypothetical protein [Acidobacteriota bacterium]